MKKGKLVREQLESSLQRLEPLVAIEAPPKGWIRAIRAALGMSARQLAGRAGFSQQALSRIERDELTGSVTVRMLKRVAESLDCVFVYGFVPRSSLTETVREQARRVATRRLGQAVTTMALEAQALGKQENQRILSGMVDQLADNPPANLWDEA